MSTLVSLEFCEEYCNEAPFSPSMDFPEYPFDNISHQPNYVYDAVRMHLYNLGLDKDNFGESSWNPFKQFNLVGRKILIKPNWVKHIHPKDETIWSVITHPSYIRVILDYIYIATKGDCTIIIGDSPVQTADFERILDLSKIKEIQDFFTNYNLKFKIEDFRYEKAVCNTNGLVIKRELLSEDKHKSLAVNISDSSLHNEIEKDYKRYRVTDYNKKQMLLHHRPGHHEYLVSRSAIECDLFINIPKAKTHRKAGVTLSLKNLVGINCSKDWLPHHRQGVKSKHADEYKDLYLFQWLGVFFAELADMQKRLLFKKAYSWLSETFWKMHRFYCKVFSIVYYNEGSWYGNDTLWRTCLDLNRILLHSNKQGILEEDLVKDYLTIIDGVIGGEKEGPLNPTPIESNFTVASLNPVSADFIAAYAMGLNPLKIPIISNSFSIKHYPLCKSTPEKIEVKSSNPSFINNIEKIKKLNKFKPSEGWANQIEL